MKVEIDPEIAEQILPLVRGLKLGRDLKLAEKAVRAERELTEKLDAVRKREKPHDESRPMSGRQTLDLSTRLRRWREARKLTRAEAARRLHVPYRTLQDWELGKRIPRGIANRLLMEKLQSLR